MGALYGPLHITPEQPGDQQPIPVKEGIVMRNLRQFHADANEKIDLLPVASAILYELPTRLFGIDPDLAVERSAWKEWLDARLNSTPPTAKPETRNFGYDAAAEGMGDGAKP